MHDQVQSQVFILSNKIVIVVVDLFKYHQLTYLNVFGRQVFGKPQNLLAKHLHLELLDEGIAKEEFDIQRFIFIVFLLFFRLTCNIKFFGIFIQQVSVIIFAVLTLVYAFHILHCVVYLFVFFSQVHEVLAGYGPQLCRVVVLIQVSFPTMFVFVCVVDFDGLLLF